MSRPVVRPVPLEARQGEPKAHTGAQLSVQMLTREARKVMATMGLDLSQNRLQRIIRRYLAKTRDVDFTTWFITYADPTGEQAVRNVARQVRS